MGEATVAEDTFEVKEIVYVDPDSTKEMEKNISSSEAMVMSMEIRDDEDLANAGDIARNIKTLEKKVNEYWEDLRVSAYKTYQDVLARKNNMLSPIKHAEEVLKNKMTAYKKLKLEEEKKKLEELEKIKEAAAQAKLQEAVDAEQRGDKEAAEAAMADVEAYENAPIAVKNEDAKINGVTFKKKWSIVSIDMDKLPDSFAGIQLVKRTPNETAIKNLIKASEGKISIPGVVYEEDYDTSVYAKK